MSGAGLLSGEPGSSSHGATAIRIALKTVLRSAALSLAFVWGGSLAAAAQTAPAESAAEKPASKKATSQKATGQKTTSPKAAGQKDAAQKKSPAQPPASQAIDEVDPEQPVSEAVVNIAGWVIASGDNRELPFAVIDKAAAQLLVFGADGKLKGLAPALIGSAAGDESAPGVGDRELKDIPMDERTTPAGRYLAGYGPATGGESVLWVDYATAVSIHPVQTTRASKKEKRKERLASATPEDNRITHGCINVSSTFYTKVIRPTFKKGGVFYVLPDSMTVETAFPAFLPASHFAANDEASTVSFTRPPPKPKPARKRPAAKAPSSKPEASQPGN